MDICISDRLPCSHPVKGVQFGDCVRASGDTVVICCRFSDVSILEYSIRKNLRGEFLVDYDDLKASGAKRREPLC